MHRTQTDTTLPRDTDAAQAPTPTRRLSCEDVAGDHPDYEAIMRALQTANGY